MKNAINYYYNLEFNDIHQFEKTYRFSVNNENYILIPYQREINEIKEIYQVYSDLIRKNVYTHPIVLNKSNEILTSINNELYILLKTPNNNRKITIDDITYFSNITIDMYKADSIRRDNWYKMWIEKIDYIEYQISEFGRRFPLIRKSISYVIGLAETGISFIRSIPNTNKSNLSISHKRIQAEYTLFDLYNPLNYIIDSRVRDASEYFKFKFFEEGVVLEEVINYVVYNQLTVTECLLFFSRMFFLTPYFDIYESIIEESSEEEQINKIIEQLDKYEKLLRKIYTYFKSNMNIDNIEWLKKT